MNSKCLSVFATACLLAATMQIPFSTSAVTSTTGSLDLSISVSGQNLILSFPTTSTNYYGLQTRSNFSQPWATVQSGIPGNGAVKTLTVSNALASSQGFYRLVVQPQPAGLILPQGDAFAILGASCGGVQEQVYATGFDPVTGYPTGDVYLKTSCGGSGRGGGYHTTTYTAWAAVTWDFAGNVISYSALSGAASVDGVFITADAFGDVLYNTSGRAYLVVPVPAMPTGVTAVQSGDQFLLTWLPNGINPIAVTSSTLTATPVNPSASTLTTAVTGSATNGAIASLQPQTTYQITVVNNALRGSSPASAPITLTTQPATVAPSAPTNLVASWQVADPAGTTDTLIASWTAAVPGNSPIDQYQVTITGSGTITQTVTGSTLTAYFSVDFTPNWQVTVKAHNAVGWGPASAPVTLGGL